MGGLRRGSALKKAQHCISLAQARHESPAFWRQARARREKRFSPCDGGAVFGRETADKKRRKKNPACATDISFCDVAYFEQNAHLRERLGSCRRISLPAEQTTPQSLRNGPFRIADRGARRKDDPIGWAQSGLFGLVPADFLLVRMEILNDFPVAALAAGQPPYERAWIGRKTWFFAAVDFE